MIAFPDKARREAGYALYLAQIGAKAIRAKPLKGFGGVGGGLEVVADDDGDTYRAVYTVKFAEVVFVLHAFQKKSRHGIATAMSDIELIRRRIQLAAEAYKKMQEHNPR